MVLEGRISLREASDRMQISYRHAKRLKHVVARDGRGAAYPRKYGQKACQWHCSGAQAEDRAVVSHRVRLFNDTHFTEKFLFVEGIRFTRETVRSIRRRAEILPKRPRVLAGISSAGLQSPRRG